MTNPTDLNRLRQLILSTKGRIFHVRFIKRSTGEPRHMTCRLGVSKHRKGGKLSFDPVANDLVPVFDMDKGQYRNIPLEGVFELRFEGQLLFLADGVQKDGLTPP